MNMAMNLLLTFLIGFVAGVSPFLFMYLIPGLLNPSQELIGCNPWCILLTGVLIGAITCILFAKKFAEKDPSDIFFYALGIPAILIGTLTNLNTTYSKMDIQKTANQLIETKPTIKEIDKEFSDLSRPGSRSSQTETKQFLDDRICLGRRGEGKSSAYPGQGRTICRRHRSIPNRGGGGAGV